MLDYPSSNKEENLIDKITSLFQSEPENVEELTEIIQNASNNNVINKDTLNMIEGIFELSKLRVRDIMVPRSSMVSVLINDPIPKRAVFAITLSGFPHSLRKNAEPSWPTASVRCSITPTSTFSS